MTLREYLFNFDYNDAEYSAKPEDYININSDQLTDDEIKALSEYFDR
jgi:hypothetical protein